MYTYIVFTNLVWAYKGERSLCRYSGYDPDLETTCGAYTASNLFGWTVFILFILSTVLAWKIYQSEGEGQTQGQFDGPQYRHQQQRQLPQTPPVHEKPPDA